MSHETKRPIPLLEVSLSLFSLYAAILMLITDGVLSTESVGLYGMMHKVAPQSVWGLSFLIAAVTKVVGLLINNVVLRMIGLVMSAFVYGTITICYGFIFPNFGFGLFFVLTFMSLMSVAYVRYTEL